MERISTIDAHAFFAITVSALGGVCLLGGRVLMISAPALELADRINPNYAPLPVLVSLPGIGMSKARAIIQFRQDHPVETTLPIFSVPEDLMKVPGLGPVTVGRLRPFLSLPSVKSEIPESKQRKDVWNH